MIFTQNKAVGKSKYLLKTLTFLILVTIFTQFIFTPETFSAASATADLKINGTSKKVSVSGFSASSSGRYTFNGSLTYTIDSPVDTKFNKYSISYYSDQALKGFIYYTESSQTKSEEFFLEKTSSELTFTSFTDNYLDGKKATKISKIVFTPLSASTATFGITSIATNDAKVYADDTIYIENNRFLVGCCLIWGGGLNYIEDKKDGDSSISNMLNEHDTGRLVQQSYYGISEEPYDCGYYGETKWGYNPVQGGNLYGEKSKLIDCVVTDTYIYVKCRPRDWAKEDMYSYSYMENIYTIEETHITVDNRFIDFSGYDHGSPRHQELPAFYTLSYFDSFTFYNGNSPWTNGKLTTKKNLGFWGEQANQAECYTDIKSGNSETWCAWISSETNYGIGLYTPNITTLLAGRFQHDNSKSSTSNSTNYVAPLQTYTIQSFVPHGYTYYITAGNVDNIRSVFKAKATNTSIETKEIDYTRLTFSDSYELNAFSKTKDSIITHSNGVVKFVAPQTPEKNDSFDMYAYVNYAMNQKTLYTNEYKYVVLTYMIPTTNKLSSYNMEVFTAVGDQINAAGGKSFSQPLQKDGKYHALVMNLSDYSDLWPATKTQINKLRFDFFQNLEPGDTIYVTEISLAKTQTEANNIASESLSAPTSAPSATAKPNTTENPGATPINPSSTYIPPLFTGSTIETSAPTTTPGQENEGDVQVPQSTAKPGNDNPDSNADDTTNDNSVNSDNNENDNYIDNDSVGFEDGSDKNIFIIIGIISGAIALTGAIVLTVLLIIKKKKSNK